MQTNSKMSSHSLFIPCLLFDVYFFILICRWLTLHTIFRCAHFLLDKKKREQRTKVEIEQKNSYKCLKIPSFFHSFINCNITNANVNNIVLRNLVIKYQRILIPWKSIEFFLLCLPAQIEYDLTHWLQFGSIVIFVIAILFICKMPCSFNLSTAEPMEIYTNRKRAIAFTLFCAYFQHTDWSTSWS